MPSAILCVPCLEESGDVPIYKRFDEPGIDGEVIQTFFLTDQRISNQLRHTNTKIADEECFAAAVGDDSHLAAELFRSLDVARGLVTVFEEARDE